VDAKSISNKASLSPALKKGQIWKAKDAYIQIMDLGKRLIDYKMLSELGQMRRTQTTAHQTLEAYLKANGAHLVKRAGPGILLKRSGS
jgi:hypothetical protein